MKCSFTAILGFFFGLSISAAPAPPTPQESADLKMLNAVPIPDPVWLYKTQFTDDQGCWDAKLIDTSKIILAQRLANQIQTPKYKAEANARLEGFLQFDGPSRVRGEFDGECPDENETAKLLGQANILLRNYGLEIKHSPFEIDIYQNAGDGGVQYELPKDGNYERLRKPGPFGGTVSIQPAPKTHPLHEALRTLPAGDPVTVTARANPGFKFEGWESGEMMGGTFKRTLISRDPTLRLTMLKDESLTAKFVPLAKK